MTAVCQCHPAVEIARTRRLVAWQVRESSHSKAAGTAAKRGNAHPAALEKESADKSSRSKAADRRGVARFSGRPSGL